jgi:hypothetical protein
MTIQFYRTDFNNPAFQAKTKWGTFRAVIDRKSSAGWFNYWLSCPSTHVYMLGTGFTYLSFICNPR